MKKSLKKRMKVGFWTTLIFLLGFVCFYIVFDQFWLSVVFPYNYKNTSFPDIQGAFLAGLIIATPLFLPYFVLAGVFTTSKICTRHHNELSRFYVELFGLTPFMLFNLFCFLFVASDWVGPEYILGNHVLFLLGLFFIVLPSTGAFIYFNERYYKQCQGE